MLNFNMTARTFWAAAILVAGLGLGTLSAAESALDYRILATSRTSTMEKELNEAAQAGYRFSRAMGGRTAGGQEVVVAMVKESASSPVARKYKLLATNRTSSMQKELQEAADEGYEYLDQTVFSTSFGGKEVVVILELDPTRTNSRPSYRLLATNKTSTMQKELKELGEQGYELLGLTVGGTSFGGDEIVGILRKGRE